MDNKLTTCCVGKDMVLSLILSYYLRFNELMLCKNLKNTNVLVLASMLRSFSMSRTKMSDFAGILEIYAKNPKKP